MAKQGNYWNNLQGSYTREKASARRLKQKRDWASRNAIYSPGIEKRGLEDKQWIRADMEKNYRIWKNAHFLETDWFLVGLQKLADRNIAAKRPALYHICGKIKDFVLFSKVEQSDGEYGPHCYCGDEVPDGVKMIFRLQKLKKIR